MKIDNIDSKNSLESAQKERIKSADDDFEKRLKAAAESGDESKLKQVCKEFEGIFINMMYKQMKATVPKSDYLQSDSATELYNSMLDDQLCNVAAQKGMGLGDMMYKQMSRQYLKNGTGSQTSGGVVDEKK